MGGGYWIKNTDTHRKPHVCSSTENDWDWDNSEGPSSFRVKTPKCLLSTYLAKRELGCVVDAVLNRTFELRLREWGSWLGMWISERRSSTNSAREHVTTLKDTHVHVFKTLCRTPDLSSFMDCSLYFFSSLSSLQQTQNNRQNLSKTPAPTYSHSITTKFPVSCSNVTSFCRLVTSLRVKSLSLDIDGVVSVEFFLLFLCCMAPHVRSLFQMASPSCRHLSWVNSYSKLEVSITPFEGWLVQGDLSNQDHFLILTCILSCRKVLGIQRKEATQMGNRQWGCLLGWGWQLYRFPTSPSITQQVAILGYIKMEPRLTAELPGTTTLNFLERPD